jgi:D-amino-acid dehydrogenase
MKADVLVLGAGMVGVSVALHLQRRGRQVVLVDRRGPAEETSYGNAGIIQREGVVPYMFPREWATVLRYALNRTSEAHYHLSALPSIAPFLWRYWRASTPAGKAASARAMMPLVERCIVEHELLMGEAGITGMIRRTGYLRLYRDPAKLEASIGEDEREKRAYGVDYRPLDRKGLADLEPHIRGDFAGAILMPDPVSVPDPGGVGKAYADLLQRQGGRFVEAEARTLERVGDGWRVAGRAGPVAAREAVVALGPWANDITDRLGLRIPLGWKRGYHMHFGVEGNATLARPVIDTDFGFALAPMKNGIRLTTGAEFARRDAAPTPVQLEQTEPAARKSFPLAARLEAEPWLGRRPCLPDMVPVIGPASTRGESRLAGLWLAFGHHHLGFTLGPSTGRLLAEMMTGDTPFTDPTPYRADRF